MSVEKTFRAVDRFGAQLDFEVLSPTLAIENEGDRQYRIAYSKALAEGVYPRNKMREVMRSHGMWTDEDDRIMREEVANLAILQMELEQAQLKGKQDECLEIAKKMRKHRFRMWELFMIQQSVYMNSAEGIAELVKAEAVMAACTALKATGQRYWPTYAEFVRERDESSISTVYVKAVEVQNQLLLAMRDTIEDSHPENRYLKDAKQAMFDRDIEERVAVELEARKQKALETADDNGLENRTA
jgi:myo-inositol catabolism protein IolC